MYVDTMDPSRLVQPVTELAGKRVNVKVYWLEGQHRVYGGKTEVPTSLFASPAAEAYGFVPYAQQR